MVSLTRMDKTDFTSDQHPHRSRAISPRHSDRRDDLHSTLNPQQCHQQDPSARLLRPAYRDMQEDHLSLDNNWRLSPVPGIAVTCLDDALLKLLNTSQEGLLISNNACVKALAWLHLRLSLKHGCPFMSRLVPAAVTRVLRSPVSLSPVTVATRAVQSH